MFGVPNYGLSRSVDDGQGGWSQHLVIGTAAQLFGGSEHLKQADELKLTVAKLSKELEEINNQADPCIEALIKMLEQLKNCWQYNVLPDPLVLQNVVAILEKFRDHKNPTQLFYPQKTSDKENPKQAQAQQSTQQLIQEQIRPLIAALQNYLNPSLHHHTSQPECLLLIDQLIQALEEVADKQRSIPARAAHIAVQLGRKVFKEIQTSIVAQSKQTFTPHKHPLLELLALISRYALQHSYLECDRVREITLALQKLGAQYPVFKVALLDPRSPVRQLHQGLTSEVINIISSLASTDQVVVCGNIVFQLHKHQRKYLDEVALGHKKKKEEFYARNKGILTVASWEVDVRASQTEQDWNALKQQCDREFEQAQKQAQEQLRVTSENLQRNLVGTLKTFCSSTQQLLPGAIFSQVFLQEVLWKALAYQQQKDAWSKIPLVPGEMQGINIMTSLDKAIDYYERYECIKEGLSETEIAGIPRVFNPYVMAWLSFAKEQMRNQETDVRKLDEIDAAFARALWQFNQGEMIASLRSIQQFIGKSSYWQKLQAGQPSLREELTAVLTGFIRALPPPLRGDNGPAKRQVIESALAFACFEFVAHLLGLKDKAAKYESLMTAFRDLKNMTRFNAEVVRPILNTFVRTDKHLASIEKCFKSEGPDHKQLYLALINMLICENGRRFSPRAWAAWMAYSSMYDSAGQLIGPLSWQVFDEIESLTLNPGRGLSNKHRMIIQKIAEALSVYGKTDLSRSQITRQFGYAMVDRVHLPDYAQTTFDLITKLGKMASTPMIQGTFEYPVLVIQYIAAIIPYMILALTYSSIEAGTYVAGALLRQAAKWYIWKSDVVGRELDRALQQITSGEGDSVVETVMLEELEKFLARTEQRHASGPSLSAPGDRRSKVAISQVVQSLLEVFVPSIATHEQLSKLLAPALLKDLKSSLQKDKVDTMLRDILLKIDNKLQGRPPAVRPVPAGDRWAQALERLRKNVIAPASDRFIDEPTKTSSQRRLDYIRWLQIRLASPGEHNILRQLENPQNAYAVYGQFLQEMIQQANVANDSPELADLLRELIPDLRAIGTHVPARLEFANKQMGILARLMRIEEQEKAKMMHPGFQDNVQHKVTAVAKTATKTAISTVVKVGIGPVVEELRGLGDNKAFMKHMVLYSMGALLKA